jgi:uncharacterized membrane protein YphA (DoxX/SURF4 family)
VIARVREWIAAPQPIARLALVRVVAPLVILGFLSSRLVHADEWLSTRGFQLPDLGGGDWRQPLYLAPLPPWAAFAVAGVTTAVGVALAIGLMTRLSAALFAAATAYLALADRLEAFTVSKLAPMIALALAFSSAGERFSLDARLGQGARRTHAPGGSLRFFQLFLVVMYSASGIAKIRGDWLTRPVLFSLLHDSYQSAFAYFMASHLPLPAWTVLQAATVVFEVGAPLWFALPWTRRPALGVGLAMHALIGLMFGPVIWFSALMCLLLLACFGPSFWNSRRVGSV